MPLNVTVTQTGGAPLPAGTTLAIDVSVTGPSVLEPTDITYLGLATLPADDQAAGTRFGYSTGAMSGRIVDGKPHLFITQATQETGWPDPVAELLYTDVGQRMTLVKNHGDITQGKRVSQAGNPKPIKGLLWDEASQRLFWTYMDQYNVAGIHDPSFGASTLEPALAAAGPWRTNDPSQHTGGYMAAIPESLQSAFGGHTFLAGAPLFSGDASSPFGTCASALSAPSSATPADTTADQHITMNGLQVIYSDINNRQARAADADECGWTHYGESNAQGNQPQWNPIQDGRGCTVDGDLCGASRGPVTAFCHVDTITGLVWVGGESKQGVLAFGQLARTMEAQRAEYGTIGRCDVWYGPAQNYGVAKLSPYGQNDTRYGVFSTGPSSTTMQASLFIYRVEDLLAVAAGTKSPIGVVPATDAFDMGQLPAAGTPFPSLATAVQQYGGAWISPVVNGSALLFLSAIHMEWQGEWRPVVHVFRITC